MSEIKVKDYLKDEDEKKISIPDKPKDIVSEEQKFLEKLDSKIQLKIREIEKKGYECYSVKYYNMSWSYINSFDRKIPNSILRTFKIAYDKNIFSKFFICYKNKTYLNLIGVIKICEQDICFMIMGWEDCCFI